MIQFVGLGHFADAGSDLRRGRDWSPAVARPCVIDPGQIERTVKGLAGEDARVGFKTSPMTPWLVREMHGGGHCYSFLGWPQMSAATARGRARCEHAAMSAGSA